MNTLLLFFAFPVAVIIFSIVLERLLNNPIIVASLVFAVFLVVTFAAYDATFLIATLAYTVLALITALIVNLLENRDNLNDDEIINNENSNTCGCGCSRYRRR